MKECEETNVFVIYISELQFNEILTYRKHVMFHVCSLADELTFFRSLKRTRIFHEKQFKYTFPIA